MAELAQDRFAHLPAEKRDRILAAAMQEFAARDFEGARTRVIAENAGISTGALFTYFATKEDLFTYIVGVCADTIQEQIGACLKPGLTLWEILEALIRLVQHTARTQREQVQLYLSVADRSSSEAASIASQMERFAAETYTAIFVDAQAAGLIRGDVPAAFLAFTVDNLLVMLQHSYCDDYYADRMRIYLGLDALDNDDDVVAHSMAIIRSMMEVPQ